MSPYHFVTYLLLWHQRDRNVTIFPAQNCLLFTPQVASGSSSSSSSLYGKDTLKCSATPVVGMIPAEALTWAQWKRERERERESRSYYNFFLYKYFMAWGFFLYVCSTLPVFIFKFFFPSLYTLQLYNFYFYVSPFFHCCKPLYWNGTRLFLDYLYTVVLFHAPGIFFWLSFYYSFTFVFTRLFVFLIYPCTVHCNWFPGIQTHQTCS